MSGREFFVKRYQELGWKYENIELMQSLRINVTNAGKRNVVKRLKSLGIELEKIPFVDHGYWVVESDFSVGATPEYLLGLYSIQEAAAQIPSLLFEELEGKTILDACAAPGGKTVQLSDLTHNTGVIIALDVRKSRLTALSNHLERCSARNTIVYLLDARRVSRLKKEFDKVLLDVPCSGNFATDERWFERRTIEDVRRNARLQRQILARSVEVLKAEGELVYSTCSLEPEEDELNVDWAIKNLNLEIERINSFGEKGITNISGRELDSSIENCRRIWPGLTQGFFVCKFRKHE